MEQNIPMVAKKILKIVKVVYLMLRKGVSKTKLLLNLSMMKHRRKITSEALIHHLLSQFNHHNNHHDKAEATNAPPTQGGSHLLDPSNRGEYEFSCSSTPLYHQYLPKKKIHRGHVKTKGDVDFNEVSKALEMVVSGDVSGGYYSPALSGLGFGPSPVVPVREPRVTDSPYPVQNPDPEDHRIDHEAEEFINRFYSQLIKQHKQV